MKFPVSFSSSTEDHQYKGYKLHKFLRKLEHGTLWLHRPVKVLYLLPKFLCLHCFKDLLMVFPELAVFALLAGCIHCVSSMTYTQKISATLVFLHLQKCLNVQITESRVCRTECCQGTLHIFIYFILFTNFAKDKLAGEISQNYCSNNETPKHAKKQNKKKTVN